MAKARKAPKKKPLGRIVLRTGEALVEAEPAWSAAEPEVVIGELDGPVGYAIAQLVAYNLCDITIKGGWLSPARLHLIPHANAPVADLPVRRIVEGRHFIADLSLPYGRVLHDYLAADQIGQQRELAAAA